MKGETTSPQLEGHITTPACRDMQELQPDANQQRHFFTLIYSLSFADL